MRNKGFFWLLIILAMSSCKDQPETPRPPCFLRVDFPEHTYKQAGEGSPVTFDLASIYKLEHLEQKEDGTYKGKIDLGQLNGLVYLHYYKIKEPLSFYINHSNDEIDRHKLKAKAINDEQILRPKDSVYGTSFELVGDVATPFQFYLTDSVTHFLYAEVLFNSRPNYDSLKPTLDYFKEDLNQILESIKWAP